MALFVVGSSPRGSEKLEEWWWNAVVRFANLLSSCVVCPLQLSLDAAVVTTQIASG